jgi:hypothetical protein
MLLLLQLSTTYLQSKRHKTADLGGKEFCLGGRGAGARPAAGGFLAFSAFNCGRVLRLFCLL